MFEGAVKDGIKSDTFILYWLYELSRISFMVYKNKGGSDQCGDCICIPFRLHAAGYLFPHE